MTEKKEAAYPYELGGETGDAAAKSGSTCNDDIKSLIRRVLEVEHKVKDIDSHLWQELVDTAKRHVESRTWFNIQRKWEEWREAERAAGDGGAFKLDNSDSAIVSRLLLEAVPEAKPYLQTRRSKFDEVFKLRSQYATSQEATS
jgi:hypothetical protein